MKENRNNIWIYREIFSYILLLIVLFILYQKWVEQPTVSPAGPEIGSTYEIFQELIPSDINHIVIIAVSPSCPFCNQSLPFYKQITDEIKNSSRNVHIVAVVSNESLVQSESLAFQEANIDVAEVIAIPFQDADIDAVPGIIVANSHGTVLKYWRGLINSKVENEVIDAISSL